MANEDTLRLKAIEMHTQGIKVTEISRRLERTRQWVHKWINRHRYCADGWELSQSNAPHSKANKTKEELEALVVSSRIKLKKSPHMESGAFAIWHDLIASGIKPPSVATINRILNQRGLTRRKVPYQKSGIRFVRYLIHCIHIMKFCFCNVNVGRNLSDHIKQGVHLDSALGVAEVCPLEQTHAKIYRRRIESVELAIENERPCDSLALGKVNHMVGKLLKYLVISLGVSIRQIAQLYVAATKTEMVTLTLDSVNDCRNFSETITARELSEHHDKELIPTGEMLHPLITFVSFYNAIKDSFRKKTNELTEYVLCLYSCLSDSNIGSKYVKIIQIDTRRFILYLIKY